MTSGDDLRTMDTNVQGRSEYNQLHGLLVSYDDDQLDECVNSALKKKSRVKYRCMDTFANFLAFGTSGGAIYLYKLKSLTHSSCSLVSIIACDQGSIEAVRFLPNAATDDLLVAMGTARGSLVIFRLSQLPGDQNPTHAEIYRAEVFTNGTAIKMIECDMDLLDPSSSFNKLYICDMENRLYVLDSNNIYSAKQSLRLRFYSSVCLPALIFSVTDSNINQISIHRSQLLISTDKTTRLFNEQSNQLHVIGKKKRKDGLFGACFFNQNYRPTPILPMSHGDGNRDSNQNFGSSSIYSSTTSMADLENILMFVARPMFRLWQVNCKRTVMFTHQFESLIKESRFNSITHLHNEPIGDNCDDNYHEVMKSITGEDPKLELPELKSDHFQKIIPIYSSTLGNLLLSYTQHELYVIDPIRAKLIAWCSLEASIVQVCTNENELYVWCSGGRVNQMPAFQIRRLVILAPTQFVLELHRLHKYMTLIAFVQSFKDIFRQIMALPLSSSAVITTEGGLLRNVLISAWDMYVSRKSSEGSNHTQLNLDDDFCVEFKRIVDDIIEEGKQLKQSLDNLTDSQFFLAINNENFERLCSEPYTSFVSLEISLTDLHSNRVIRFSKEAIDRHKSVVNLSQSIKQLNRLRQVARSNYDLSQAKCPPTLNEISNERSVDAKVIVERQKPKRLRAKIKENEDPALKPDIHESHEGSRPPSDIGLSKATSGRSLTGMETRNHVGLSASSLIEENSTNGLDVEEDTIEPRTKGTSYLESLRCHSCLWPKARSHLKQLVSSQQIQCRWIEDNLLSDFKGNLEKIQELSFQHSLWRLYLKCLSAKDDIDEFIDLCLVLDDVNLLDIEQLSSSRLSPDELLDKLLKRLTQNADYIEELKVANSLDSDAEVHEQFCVRCGARYLQHSRSDLETSPQIEYQDQLDVNSNNSKDEYESSFNLINLFEQFMVRPNVDVKKLVSHFNNYPRLVNSSKIPASFYLKAIRVAVSIANQSPLSFARMNQLRETSRSTFMT